MDEMERITATPRGDSEYVKTDLHGVKMMISLI